MQSDKTFLFIWLVMEVAVLGNMMSKYCIRAVIELNILDKEV